MFNLLWSGAAGSIGIGSTILKSNPQAQLALFLVTASIVIVLAVEMGAEFLQKVDWFEPRMVALPVLACAIIGTILGWLNLRSSAGKLAAMIGSAMLLYVFLIYSAKSTAQQETDLNSRRIEGRNHSGRGTP